MLICLCIKDEVLHLHHDLPGAGGADGTGNTDRFKYTKVI